MTNPTVTSLLVGMKFETIAIEALTDTARI